MRRMDIFIFYLYSCFAGRSLQGPMTSSLQMKKKLQHAWTKEKTENKELFFLYHRTRFLGGKLQLVSFTQMNKNTCMSHLHLVFIHSSSVPVSSGSRGSAGAWSSSDCVAEVC